MAKTTENLGLLAIYSLNGNNLRMRIEDLRDLFKANSIPADLFPQITSTQGAFERATTYAAQTLGKDKLQPIVMRELSNDKENVIRVFEQRVPYQDDLEKINQGGENKPVYKHIATMRYSKKQEAIEFTNALTPQGQECIAVAQQKYRELNEFFNIIHIRKMIQDAFKYYNGILFRRNGGVTFIPVDNIKAFQNFAKMCNQMDGIELICINMQMSKDNKTSVLSNLERHVNSSLEDEIKALGGKTVGNEALEELISTFYAELGNKKISERKLQTLTESFNNTMKLVSEYEKLLDCNLDVMKSQVSIAQAQLQALLNKELEEDV